RLKNVPEGGEDVTVTELHASVAVMDQVTEMLVLHVRTIMFDGQKIVGLFVSLMVTVWLQVAELVQQSAARQVRVIEHPLVTVPTMLMVTLEAQQASYAVGLSKDQAVPHWTVLLVGQVILGGWLSMNV